jgi:hypothetical protein
LYKPDPETEIGLKEPVNIGDPPVGKYQFTAVVHH